MGYARYEIGGMERGYAVEDTCHFEGCSEEIDRGLSFLCYGCELYFCPKHLTTAWKLDGNTVIKLDCFAGYESQCCLTCSAEAEANPEMNGAENSS